MLMSSIERYLSLRQALGAELRDAAQHLRSFGRFAAARGDDRICAATAIEWATTARTPHARHVRLRDVVKLAQFLAAEDPAHEVPPLAALRGPFVRPLPYIYTPDEVATIVATAGRIRPTYPLRQPGYAALFGLIAATGLRVSEALDLQFDDVLPEGVLRIRHTKFGKGRLVPLHPATQDALGRYLVVRRAVVVPDDHLFLSATDKRIHVTMAEYTFRRILKVARIAPDRVRRPRIHDLRHTFATRALERCASERQAVSRHFVALSTYLGHVDIKQTYWYLEATPELMVGVATAAEALAAGGGQ